MNALVVDTSAWISYFKGQENEDLDLALREGRVYLPSIVIAELLSGKIKPHLRLQLQEFLSELPICDASFNHWVKVGELRAKLLAKGFSISTPDAHIAQCALDLKCYLLSEDKIFNKIAKTTGLRLIV